MVRVIWNNVGGELNRTEAVDENEPGAVLVALVDMIGDTPIDAGDSFVVEEV